MLSLPIRALRAPHQLPGGLCTCGRTSDKTDQWEGNQEGLRCQLKLTELLT